MTLDDAIEHCYQKAREQESKGCSSCALDHLQLAEWLMELKGWRTSMENVKKAVAERKEKSQYIILGDI